ncbi:MAG: anti-sigma factor [Chromatiales bacterium]|nr:anti-sigma factor [Chromatiales bacterium]
MTYEQSDQTSTAGEYVLGTLSDDELEQFEEQLSDNEQLQKEIATWQDHLAPLLLLSEPVTPPQHIWSRIEQRITPTPTQPNRSLWDSLFFWRTLGFSTAALALLLSASLYIGISQSPTLAPVGAAMVVMNDKNQAGWLIDTPLQAGSLRVTAIAPTPMPPGKVCRIWLTSPAGGVKSLGILPDSGWKQLSLPPKRATDSRLMISIENKDEPLSAPTGKVIFTSEPIQI